MKSLKATIAQDVEIKKCRYCEFAIAHIGIEHQDSVTCTNIDSLHRGLSVRKYHHCKEWMRATGSDDDIK